MSNENEAFESQFVEDATSLILDPKHPGLGDVEYLKRREHFFALAREYRLADRGVPRVEYTDNDRFVWREVCAKLKPIHEAKACKMYLEGRKILQIPTEDTPQLADLSAEIKELTGFGIAPAEGLINFRDFFGYLARGKMLCTQYLRHHSKPGYTPEPDMVHDVLGHVPFLVNQEYVDYVRLVGRASQLASDEQLVAFNRLYWFGIEFGLIEEQGEIKVFGAGLLSSIGEMEFCYSDEVTRLPFDIFDVTQRDYDPTQMQQVVYVIPSVGEMRKQTEELIRKFGLDASLAS